MTQEEAEAVVAVATLAALADGHRDEGEQNAIAAVAARFGLADDVMQRASSGQLSVADLAGRLTTPESRQAAYDAALSVCHGDGDPSALEQSFLASLAATLGISADNAASPIPASVPLIAPVTSAPGAATVAAPGAAGAGTSASAGASAAAGDDTANHILDQAILTAALEFLPDRLANMAILPLQMRLVYGIGQRHGQQLNAKQIADLAATFGIGAVAQVFEKVVRRALGGVAGGLLGGMLGGATGFAAGAAVTFASTYALGHAAEQYYAQGRALSPSDMKALFTRFQKEATELYPRVQQRIQQRASGTNLSSIMQSIRG